MNWPKLLSPIVGASLVGFTACTSTAPTDSSVSPAAPKVESLEAGLVEPATFAKWPSAYDRPIPVAPAAAAACSMGRIASDSEAKHGPHANHSMVVRVSPEAIGAFRAGKAMPAGAVVVKEKYPDDRAAGPPKEYGLMIKREVGYDPGNGDWEYAYVTSGAERKVTRGKLAQCATCHANVKDADYLFRSYAGYGR